LRMAIEAFVLACVITILGETSLLKNYFEERLDRLVTNSAEQTQTRLGQVLIEDFVRRAQDETFLRSFAHETLSKIEGAVQRASFPESMPHQLEPVLAEFARLRSAFTLCRSDFHLSLHYEHHHTNSGIYSLTSQHDFRLYNWTGKPYEHALRMSEAVDLMKGVGDDEYYKIKEVRVNGDDVTERLMSETLRRDSRIIFSNEYRFTLSADPESYAEVRKITKALYPKSSPSVLTFYFPVHGLDVTLEHPQDVVPFLFVFGVGSTEVTETDPLPPFIKGDTLHRWKYDGWFPPDHGVVLMFSSKEDQAAAEEAAVRS
jgi:hypothetical protein